MRQAFIFRAAPLVISFVVRSFACSCTPAASAPACEKLATADVAFVGTVLAAEPDTRRPAGTRFRVYRFRVDTAYKGLADDAKQLMVNPDNFTSCQTEYLLGKKYLVFASHLAGTDELLSGGCHGSRMAEYATEDIQFLETYRFKRASNLVYGRVLQWVTTIGRPRRDEDAPVEGADVVLSDRSQAWKQRTTGGGDFRFENIPAGSYSLAAQLDPYIPNPVSLSIDVPPVGCVERFPVLEARASVSGQVLDEFRRPAPRKRVELLRGNRSGAWYSTYQFWKQTDERGEFIFDGLPDGDYLLGYEIWGDRPSNYSPYPTVYFPGVVDRASASVLHLAPRQAINDLRIPLSSPHTPRKIHVEVVWPNGRAPAANLLQLFSGNDLIKNVGGSLPNRSPVRHSGIVEFTGYAERHYDLNVRYWIDDLGEPVPHNQQKIARSEVVRLSAGKEPASVKLVLTKTLFADADR